MFNIKHIIGREIIDSRGNPTVEADVILDDGHMGRASVPSGASTGKREAVELRDGDNKRYFGKGVTHAVEHIDKPFLRLLQGTSVLEQQKIDETLISFDGTENKSKMGANAMLAVSLACAKAAAQSQKQPLYHYLANMIGNHHMKMPLPLMNILNGGAHADNNVDIQEFMIAPIKAVSFAESLRMGIEVYHTLKSNLKKHNLATAVGDEGGFAPDLKSNSHAVELILSSIEQAGFSTDEVAIALDVAASEFYEDGLYHLQSENKKLTSGEFVSMMDSWVSQYPIVSIEDALAEDDWDGWASLSKTLKNKVQLVGDDLFVTNPKIFKEGIDKEIANAILIKPNQIGTLSETLEAIQMAKDNDYNAVISHRSGETEDAFIADLAVATGVGQIKTGAPCRSDRVAKYNQLLRIEQELKVPFSGGRVFNR